MKYLIVACIFMTSCAYNSQTITAGNNSTIKCDGSVDKPVSLSNSIPVQANGNTVPVSAIP